MAPRAKLEFAVEAWVAFLGIPQKLRLAKDKGRIVDAEIDAVAVAELRVIRTRPRRVTVENCPQHREVVRKVSAKPCPDSSQRRGRTSARQVERQPYRPAERRVGEDVRIFCRHELGVGCELPG